MVSATNGRHSKASSTRDSLSKLKSFFKKSKDENTKKVNASSITGIKSVVFHETKPFLKVEYVTTAQPKDKRSVKNKFKSFFNIKGKEAKTPAVVEQRLHDRRRRLAMNKVKTFFAEKVLPVFTPSNDYDNMSEYKKKLLAAVSMDYDIKRHVEGFKQLTSEIKQVECCL